MSIQDYYHPAVFGLEAVSIAISTELIERNKISEKNLPQLLEMVSCPADAFTSFSFIHSSLFEEALKRNKVGISSLEKLKQYIIHLEDKPVSKKKDYREDLIDFFTELAMICNWRYDHPISDKFS